MKERSFFQVFGGSKVWKSLSYGQVTFSYSLHICFVFTLIWHLTNDKTSYETFVTHGVVLQKCAKKRPKIKSKCVISWQNWKIFEIKGHILLKTFVKYSRPKPAFFIHKLEKRKREADETWKKLFICVLSIANS